MKKFNIKTLMILVMVLLLSVNTVFANGSEEPNTKATGMAIGDRINVPDINIITSGDVTFQDEDGNVVANPTPDSKLRVQFDWAFEMGKGYDWNLVQAGDFYQFQLPKDFVVPQVFTGSLSEYGDFHIGKDGLVTLTFNDNVSSNSIIKGNVEFDVSLKATATGDLGRKEIELPFADNKVLEFTLKPNDKQNQIEKQGKVDTTHNTKSIVWDVNINKSYETLTGVVVTDDIPESLELERIEVFPLHLNADGSYKYHGAALSPDLYTVGADNSISFKDTIHEAYTIRYHTKVKEDYKKPNGGTVNIVNKASMVSDTTTSISASASVDAEYGKLIQKDKYTYDPVQQIVEWEVRYNFGAKKILNGELVDVFSSNLEYIDGSIEIKNIKNQTVNLKTTVTPQAGGLNIKFDDEVYQELIITYKTKVKDGVVIKGGETFTNSITTENITSGISVDAEQRNLYKTSPSIDYNTKQVKWQMDVNMNQYLMDNAFITDTYTNQGLTLVDGTFKINDNQTGIELTANDYKMNKVYDAGVEVGFTVELIGNYASNKNHLTITYTTDYEPNNLINSDSVLHNVGHLVWGPVDQRISAESVASQTLSSLAVNNGGKSGSLNHKTNEIEWKINANYNSETLSGSIITDVIQDGQTFVEGSLQIWSHDLLSNGAMINQSPIALEDLDIDYPSEDNGYTLSIKLPDGSDKYYMTFRTSIEGEKIVETFKNEAIFENGSRVRNLKASVTNKHGNSFVNKSGKQNGDMINWSVVINESQSTIRNAVLKDSPSKNQIILENSFVIYKIEMNDDGSHKPNYNEVLQKGVDYELEILNHADGSQQVMVSFLNLIEDAYLMQYDSQINATENDLQIVNKIELSGNGITYVDDKGASSFKIDVSSAGGSATGTKGKLSIQKLGEGDLPLEGVVFELYNSKGNLVSRQTTDEDGNVDFRNLLYGTYTLKEISSLSGYVISDILFEGIDVAVNAQSSLETSRQELNNYMNKLIINKKDVAGRLLDGAVFTLEKKVNDTYEVITDNLVLTQGELVLKGYDAGYYRLTETQAPEGYILNTEVIDFEIKLNANDQAIDETVDVINYQGSVRLTKVDENQKLLEGVYYDLYDGNDKLVHKDLVTDVNGEIALLNSLQPGTYYFKETKSVEGNLVNETPITFDIPESFSGEPVEVSRSASNAKAAIEFKKTAGSNLGLPGAVFEIGHVDGLIPVQTVVSDTDGMVRVNQLVPGDYWIKEIQAPKGYLLNLEQGTFNIPEVTNVENYFETLADFENYQGSVELEKKDSSGKVLEGVVYKLYKDQDELIDTYTTNKQGIIAVDGLEPGDYYFKEVSSVGGNIANENPIPFKIVTEANNAPELVKLTAVNGKASVQFSKTDAQGNPLAGATFNLYNKDTDKLVTSVQSDDQGLVKVDHLSPGNYYFKEVEAPESYVINTATPSFNIPEKTTGDNYTLILDDAFVNYQASVQFKKVNVQGEALEGVGFKLFSIIDGKVSSTAISTAYSDVDGLVFFDHLGSGDYIIREFSTLDGYYLNTQEIPFTIDAAYNGAVDTLELENYINHKAVIEFKKTDVYGNALSGVHFNLIDSKGDVVDSAISNKDGVVRFEEVAVGDYTIEETQGITGYILNKDNIKVSIEKEAEGKPEVIQLEDFINYQGQIQFYKQDVNGNGLEGAEFTVYDTLGNAVQTVSSDKQGLVSFKDLPVGKYSVSETKAPKGYVRNTQTQVFEIYQETDGEPEVLTLQNIVNYKGSIMLHKVNETGHFINGARFELYDENNKLVRKIVVESGLYHIQDLAPGNYTLVETHAPVGYHIDNAKTQFTIKDTSDGAYAYETLKVVNQLDGLPGTGISSNYNLYLVMIVIGILFIALRTNLKRKY